MTSSQHDRSRRPSGAVPPAGPRRQAREHGRPVPGRLAESEPTPDQRTRERQFARVMLVIAVLCGVAVAAIGLLVLDGSMRWVAVAFGLGDIVLMGLLFGPSAGIGSRRDR